MPTGVEYTHELLVADYSLALLRALVCERPQQVQPERVARSRVNQPIRVEDKVPLLLQQVLLTNE